MEQINLNISKQKQILAALHVQASKTDPGIETGETFFDALLEQKSEQYNSEPVSETPKQSKPTDENTANEDVEKAEKPTTEKGEETEETCDVAREVAAAQIVWIVDPSQATQIQPPEQQVLQQEGEVEGIDPVVNTVVSEEAAAPVVDTLVQETEQQEAPVQEFAVTEQVTEQPVQETVQVETQVSEQPEAEVSEHSETDSAMKVEITRAESDETGGEAVVAETPLFEGVETAPIKVAEAPERTEETTGVEQQVVHKLSDLLENGETKVQIQLEPVELGKLTIELTRSADGTLNILLDAENLQTRSLLEKSIGTLQETLADRGQKVVQITVEHNEEAQRQDNQQRNDLFDERSGQQRERQEQQRRNDQRDGADFLQQLRLGLIPLGGQQ